MSQLMPLPLTVSCFSKIQIGFTFLVPAHPGSIRKRAVKRVCVCVLEVYRVGQKSGATLMTKFLSNLNGLKKILQEDSSVNLQLNGY